MSKHTVFKEIEPLEIDGVEYCWCDFAKCSHYHYGGNRDYCRITGKTYTYSYVNGKCGIVRPYECHLLEVE